MEESPVILDFIERGARRAKQEDILQVLATRFGAVPEDLERAVQQIQAIDDLDRFHVESVRCDDLNAFRQTLTDR